ncbi:AAA family ATPase [Erwinia rhapontici]|uniref:AAA family ATPase n=1 Tax=Erwinia rhapontici TaxID=55212 RepID=UPI00106215EA|nr:AAA family ATPase [Erwinia rhapontici]TDT00038.1 ATPase family protein associated with various cellular activities (AAA) [Erwinia rhapontici]
MSIAGIRSNRGDGYQTLVAFDWALTVLSDQDFEWLEVDSISYPVDDVVVGKADGVIIACQCKKNHPDFNAWTIAGLGDELDKAFLLLANNPKVNVRFYSRNNFGELAKLKEHCSSQPDESSYRLSLGKAQSALEDTLSKRLVKTAPSLSTFEFLRRTDFVTSDDLGRMEELLRERLRNLVSNTDSAFNALWMKLDQLGARMDGNNLSTATQHRLTKDDLRAIVQQVGSTLVPPMNIADIRHSFSSTSAIGRSWRRDIAGHRIANSTLDDLLAAIDARKRSILLTGLPGSGKTCVMLALQEALEERMAIHSDIVPLFIQSREFADLATSEDRQAQGMPEQWVEKTARLADETHVIVVIDSLDVLSIARDHRVLKYFLAQIDRLLLIPNLTVVTACRDFDRQYDRRIAERQWGCELKCQPLDWDSEIAPLLDTLGITAVTIDTVTRELIRNPRELALFVELAQRDGSFNVVTSHALAQRYLDTIVRANDELGNAAIQSIEAIAAEMLRLRSLVVPHQRFNASQDIQRKLCSLNVLQETQDGKLTFGHQTLLDVLVISGAVRNGITLNVFISGLPPVPFVRPSIRSFVAQLAMGERREFRKQLRAVLTGNAAFHIRRLVAESFAEQIPQDEDWPLLRELRERHREVFQVIYVLADAIEWHHFWRQHLIPQLKANRDSEGLASHVHRIAQWSNQDTSGVLSFWMEALSLDWFDGNRISDQLGMHLYKIKVENFPLVAPLLERLLAMPRSEHSFLGRAITKCVQVGVMNDTLLWRYITEDIDEEDLLQIRFDKKLRCQTQEFGGRNDNFLRQRMEQSSTLLDLAVESIEYWSHIRKSRYGESCEDYRYGFLSETSYDNTHSQRNINHTRSMSILFDAVEAGIRHHAENNTGWWKRNRERLCFHKEGALLYFGVIACTVSPEHNIDLIGRLLCERKILEFYLSYELGELINSAFQLLVFPVQDKVISSILTIRSEYADDEFSLWKLKAQAELIIPIPCYLRSPEAQAVVDAYEKKAGILINEPDISSRSGFVRSPFSFEIFLDTSDSGILTLLAHYEGYSDYDWDNTGGEQQVGMQLQEAASRNPSRFLSFLSRNWMDIPNRFRDDLMDGVVSFLTYRYGSLRPSEDWQSMEEPDATILASQILDELERHPMQWRQRRSAAKALKACAHVIKDVQEADRLIFLAIGFAALYEENPITGDSVGLINIGINMAKGHAVEALMILATNLPEQDCTFPELLSPALCRFASHEHPAIRAVMLRRLPYLQNKCVVMGWDLFNLAMQEADELWQNAEECLYYAYHDHFEIVKPLLARLRKDGCSEDLEIWGRISALATMERHINFAEFLEDLKTLDCTEAWRGAAMVWTNAENIQQLHEQCFAGISSGLSAGSRHSLAVAGQMAHIFHGKYDVFSLPLDLVKKFFYVLENHDVNKNIEPFGFHEWLNTISQQDPEKALVTSEIYLTYIGYIKSYMHDDDNSLTQLMTRLFAEAEEREESDNGAMLQRVVVVQDKLLSLGVNSIAEWLKAAERP